MNTSPCTEKNTKRKVKARSRRILAKVNVLSIKNLAAAVCADHTFPIAAGAAGAAAGAARRLRCCLYILDRVLVRRIRLRFVLRGFSHQVSLGKRLWANRFGSRA